MKLLGRSGSDRGGGPGEVRRVTGRPHSELAGVADVPGDLPGENSVDESGRLQRLARAVDRSRRNRTDRDLRKIMQVLGMLVIAFGFICLVLGWYGASHSPYLFQEIPYLISGGLLGVALVIGGGVLVRCAWSLRQVEESRRNAVAIVRSVDRLEQVLRAFTEITQHDDVEEEALPWK
jgi:hypothetical protein